MESIEVGWPAIIDIFGTMRYSLYTCKYQIAFTQEMQRIMGVVHWTKFYPEDI
jgi:hypothetical protein